MLAFSVDSREEVDALYQTAMNAGAKEATDTQDHGFMYGRSFEDLGGGVFLHKDADVVLWNGHPLSVYSRVDTTWVDGRVVFDRGMDLAMRETRAAEKARLVAAVRGDDADDDTAEAEPGADAEGADDTVEPYRFADTAAREYVSSPHAQGNVTAIVGAMVHTVSGDVIDNITTDNC